MNKTQKAIIGFVAGGILALGVASPAVAGGGNPQVCAELDSGKVDVSGDHKTVAVEAPEGFLVAGYCVKAGSVKQGNGPHYVTLDEPVESVTFGHPSGKDVSHWSASWVEKPAPEPVEPPVQVVNPNPPQFVDVCGSENDEAQIPSDTDAVTYTVEWRDTYSVTVTATANEGYAFPFNGEQTTDTYTWRYTFDSGPCEVVEPTTPDPVPPVDAEPTPGAVPELPATGLDSITAAGWLVIGFGLLTAGVAALTMRRGLGVRRKGVNK